MKSTIGIAIFAAFICAVSARGRDRGREALCMRDSRYCDDRETWFNINPKNAGSPSKDITWSKPAGDGKVFGTLGSTDQGLFGQAGYKQVIFDDARGKLEGKAHGTRVLGPNGDSSHLGGQLEWSSKNAGATLDVSKQIGGSTSISASGAGKWHPDKNTEVSAGAAVSHSGHGRPDVAVQAQVEHKF